MLVDEVKKDVRSFVLTRNQSPNIPKQSPNSSQTVPKRFPSTLFALFTPLHRLGITSMHDLFLADPFITRSSRYRSVSHVTSFSRALVGYTSAAVRLKSELACVVGPGSLLHLDYAGFLACVLRCLLLVRAGELPH